jgi:hypothetical protein
MFTGGRGGCGYKASRGTNSGLGATSKSKKKKNKKKGASGGGAKPEETANVNGDHDKRGVEDGEEDPDEDEPTVCDDYA